MISWLSGPPPKHIQEFDGRVAEVSGSDGTSVGEILVRARQILRSSGGLFNRRKEILWGIELYADASPFVFGSESDRWLIDDDDLESELQGFREGKIVFVGVEYNLTWVSRERGLRVIERNGWDH